MYEQIKLSYLKHDPRCLIKLEAPSFSKWSGETPVSVFFPSHTCEDLSDIAMRMDGPELGDVSANSFDVSRLNTHGVGSLKQP